MIQEMQQYIMPAQEQVDFDEDDSFWSDMEGGAGGGGLASEATLHEMFGLQQMVDTIKKEEPGLDRGAGGGGLASEATLHEMFSLQQMVATIKKEEPGLGRAVPVQSSVDGDHAATAETLAQMHQLEEEVRATRTKIKVEAMSEQDFDQSSYPHEVTLKYLKVPDVEERQKGGQDWFGGHYLN